MQTVKIKRLERNRNPVVRIGEQLRQRSEQMLKSGLVSVTFRKLAIEQIVDLAKQSKLQSIEWGGDVHIPAGNFAAAEKARKLTCDAKLETAAYCSYYKVVESEKYGPGFDTILKTAETLGASLIRVWAGVGNSEDVNEAYWQKVADESRRIADLAGEKNIRIAFEFHYGTLNNTPQSSKKLLEIINRPNVGTYWQPTEGASVEENCRAIDIMLDRIERVHVFHWWPSHKARHLLKDGINDWKCYLQKLSQIKKNVYASLEFVKDDNPENFLLDVQTLNELLNRE